MTTARRRVLLVAVAVGAVAALVAGLLVGRRAAVAPPGLAHLEPALSAAAREMGVEVALLQAVVAAESGGRIAAVSQAGALGLTQLMPATAREEAERRGLAPFADAELLRDGPLNLRLGAGYLARLLQRFDGEVAFALAAYNAGATHVLRWRAKAPDASAAEVVAREAFPATRAYVAKVLDLRERYRGSK